MTDLRKLWYLLNYEQRRGAMVMIVLMLIGMVLETLGVGLVIPALALMSQADIAVKYPELAPIVVALDNPDPESLVVAGMLILVAAYAAKAVFLGFLAWQQARFVFGLQSDLSQRLFSGYLLQPYTFHLQRNSAQLIRNTIGQVADVTNVFQQGLILLTELFVIVGIMALLLIVEPIGALLVLSTLAFAGWGFNRLTRNYILRWGEARQYHEGLRIQYLQEGLGGAKDVKLLGRESDFLAQYQRHNVGSAKVGKRQTALQALPRLWLEFLAVVGLASLVIVMIGQGKPVALLLPTLGLFAAAAFRLMPSTNRVLGSAQNIRFTLPAINTLHGEFCLLDASTNRRSGVPIPLRTALTLDRVSFQYAGAERQALQDISLTVQRGTTIGFIGGSGAGKSTLVDVVLGLLTPSAGTVRIDGTDIQGCIRQWQDQLGYVPQSIFLTDDSVRRNVAFGLPAGEIDEAALARAIRAAQLEQFINELPHGLDTVVGERGVRLSGGQRQRIGIARALYHNPQVLVLDEATSSLDVATEHSVMEAIRALHGDKTIIIVAHRLSTVEHCDRLYRLENGVVIEEGEASAILGRNIVMGSDQTT
jgi:ABC-type multidrug transport system fused ATPase/permease subunit